MANLLKKSNCFKKYFGKKEINFLVFTALCFFLFLNFLKVFVFAVYMNSVNVYIFWSTLIKVFALFILITAVYLFFIKFRKPYLFISFYLIQLTYIFINLSYYFYFRLYLNFWFMFSSAGEGMETALRGGVPWDPRVLIVLIDLPFFVLVLCFYKRLSAFSRKIYSLRKKLFILWLVLWTVVIGFYYIESRWIFAPFEWRYRDSAKDNIFIVSKMGTLFNNFLGVIDYYKEIKAMENIDYGEFFKKAKTNEQINNIIFIQLETVGSNIIRHKYKGEYIMPFLAKMSKENIYYPYVYAFHGRGGTSDSEFAILNNTPSSNIFPSGQLKNYHYSNSIIRQLTKNNYEAFAFHGNKGNFFGRDVAFPKYGFNKLYDIHKMNLKEQGWGAADEKVFDFVIKKLENQNEPFFYHIITMSSHEPFIFIPQYYQNAFFNDIEDSLTKNFFLSMNYVDVMLQNFIKHIQNDFPNTYIFIYGDHPPSQRVKSDLFNCSTLIIDNNYMEFVPLIIVSPQKEQHKETNKAASFLDIGITALDSSGIPFEIKSRGELLLGANLQKCIPVGADCYQRDYLFQKAQSIKKQ
jgi:lipoteichoic acid synthase